MNLTLCSFSGNSEQGIFGQTLSNGCDFESSNQASLSRSVDIFKDDIRQNKTGDTDFNNCYLSYEELLAALSTPIINIDPTAQQTDEGMTTVGK